ncbi:MAG: hypothetical protein KAI64_03805 [Thermoplasmata archaeon]|nr:hypothetical protein [Thermoplasmata archaeon]
MQIVLLALLSISLCGCGKLRREQGENILAEVGARKILEKELIERFSSLPPTQQQKYMKEPVELLRRMTEEEAIYQYAIEKELGKEPEVIRGLAEMRRNLTIARTVQMEVSDKIIVTMEEIRDWYNTDVTRPEGPLVITTSHIYQIMVNGDAEEIKEKINSGRAEGKSLSRVARENDIVYVLHLTIPPRQFDELSPAQQQELQFWVMLPPWSFSEVIKDKEHQYIFYKEPELLEDTFREIRAIIKAEKEKKYFADWIDALAEEKGIDIPDETLERKRVINDLILEFAVTHGIEDDQELHRRIGVEKRYLLITTAIERNVPSQDNGRPDRELLESWIEKIMPKNIVLHEERLRGIELSPVGGKRDPFRKIAY